MEQPQLQASNKSKFRWTIAGKIISLASVLIFFIFIIIVYSIVALKGIRADLQEIAQLDVPLTEIASSIEIHKLEQQLYLNKLSRISRSHQGIDTNNQVQTKIQGKILADKDQLAQEIMRGIVLSKQGIDFTTQVKYQEIHSSLLALQKEQKALGSTVKQVIQNLNKGKSPDDNSFEVLLIKNEHFNQEAIALIDSIQSFTQSRLSLTEKHEQTFLVVNVALGTAAVSVGILLSLIITVNIKSNIFSLSKQIAKIRQAMTGNESSLPTETEIHTNDEIGDLALEISQTVRNFSQEIEKRDRISEKLKQIATTDKLTGAFNRLKWDEDVEQEIIRSRQAQQNLAIIIFDIDFFKKVNDTFGHDVGDLVLVEVVQVTQKQIRGTDFLYRIGGEEFVILAINTDQKQIMYLGERVRRAIEQQIFPHVEHITVSMGVAQLLDTDDAQKLLKRADLALYESKKGGRNQITSS